ncbi:Angiotensin-converting enzyme [Araneus ventricosus]|uniref:Angiotensin-converting enzyme n=1 Tax=Araneus ventricosus TaxID=182803 RepID=A0A4Y2LD15_ARAVE|nr:Angiotensin-converting enzyme [Araneus ventricosus]
MDLTKYARSSAIRATMEQIHKFKPDLKYTKDGKEQSEKVSAISEMSEIFNKVKICPYKRSTENCKMSLTDIEELFETSRHPEELKYYWLEFRKKTGEKYKDLFLKSIKEDNEWAKGFGYKNKAEYNVAMYEDKDFLRNMAKEMKKILPLYKQIHAYVRKKLRVFYKNENIRKDGPIPAHLLGNIYAQNWVNIFPIVKPYPKSSGLPNVTKAMRRKQNNMRTSVHFIRFLLDRQGSFTRMLSGGGQRRLHYTTHSEPACQIGLRPETVGRGREPTVAGPETPRNPRPATVKLV